MSFIRRYALPLLTMTTLDTTMHLDSSTSMETDTPPKVYPPLQLPQGYSFPAQGVYCPPSAHYTEVPLSEEDESRIGLIIGKGGFYFKRITEAARVYYMWYNPQRHAVEIWGPENRLGNAIQRVKNRLIVAKEKAEMSTQGQTV